MEREKYSIVFTSTDDEFEQLNCEVEFEENLVIIITDENLSGNPVVSLYNDNLSPFRNDSKAYIDEYGIDADILIRAIQDGVAALKRRLGT